MDEILSYLTSIPAWYLATTDSADPAQPRVRPFSFAAVEDGLLWFSTSVDKDVYTDLMANPRFELCGWQPGRGWIVVDGQADFSQQPSAAVRQAGFEHMLGLGEHHDSPDDGRLTYFCVREGRAWLRDIDGGERVIEL